MKKLITILLIAGSSYYVMGQEVKINTDFIVETDGTVRLENDATVWDDLRVPLSEPATGTLKPDWAKFPYDVGTVAPYLNWFKATGIDEMYFVVQMPHDWAEGTTIYPHIHWVPSENGAGVPRWGLQYTWTNIGDVFPTLTDIYGSVRIPSQTGNLVKSTQYLTPLGDAGITATGKTISSMLVCRIFRDGSHADDTFTGLAGALEVDFHYQRNTIGSRQEYIK